jgi:hypothetical protein
LTALVIAFWGVDPSRLVAALGKAKPMLLLPAALSILVGLFARARSWQILLHGRVSLRRAFDALNAGYLLNIVLPFRLGELGRAYILGRRPPLTTGQVVATVVIERVIDTLVSLGGLAVALALVVTPAWAQSLVAWISLAVLLGLGALFLLMARGDRLAALLRRSPVPMVTGFAGATDEFVRGLELLSQPRRVLRAAFWSLMAWATAWLQIWLLLRAFSIHGSLVVSLLVSGVIAFGAAVPSSPGAVGGYELSAVAGLMIFGYQREPALSVAIAGHGLQLLVLGGLGAWSLAREGETLAGLAARARAALRDPRENDDR